MYTIYNPQSDWIVEAANWILLFTIYILKYWNARSNYWFFAFAPQKSLNVWIFLLSIKRERKRAHPKKSTHSAKLNLYEQEKKKKYQKSTKSCIKRKRKVLKKSETCFTVAEFWYFEHEISKSNGWICKLISNFSLSSFFFFFDFCWFFSQFSGLWFSRYAGNFWLVLVGSFAFFSFFSFFGFFLVNFYRYIFYIGRLFRSRWRSACSWSWIRQIGEGKYRPWAATARNKFKHSNFRHYIDINEASYTTRV